MIYRRRMNIMTYFCGNLYNLNLVLILNEVDHIFVIKIRKLDTQRFNIHKLYT